MAGKSTVATKPVSDTKTRVAQGQGGTASDASSKTKALDGITSIDEKVFLECEILSHSAISRIAERIALEADQAIARTSQAGASNPTIILLDQILVSALQVFSAVQLQLALIKKGFEEVASTAELQLALEKDADDSLRPNLVGALPVAAVTDAVAGVVDLLGLFRQDTQFTGRTAQIKETAVYLEVAHALRANGFEVIYPRLLGFQVEAKIQLSQKAVTDLFQDVFTAREHALGRLRPVLMELTRVEQEIVSREEECIDPAPDRQDVLTQGIQERKAELVKIRENLDPNLLLFKETDAQWNEMQRGLVHVDEKSGLTPMQLISRAAEAIEHFRASALSYFLYSEVAVAGGTMRIKRNLWRTLFYGDGISFSGGAVVSYALIDGKAHVLASRTHRYMTEFQTFPDDTPEWASFNSF